VFWYVLASAFGGVAIARIRVLFFDPTLMLVLEAAAAELDVGPFSQTKPNSPRKLLPDPTQPIIDTWQSNII